MRATTPERTSEREAGQNTWKKKQVVTTEHEYKLALPRKAFHLHLANKRLFSIFHIIGIAVPNLIIVIQIEIQIIIMRLLHQKAGGACLYMPQDGYWSANFEVIPPLKVGSSAAAKKI